MNGRKQYLMEERQAAVNMLKEYSAAEYKRVGEELGIHWQNIGNWAKSVEHPTLGTYKPTPRGTGNKPKANKVVLTEELLLQAAQELKASEQLVSSIEATKKTIAMFERQLKALEKKQASFQTELRSRLGIK